MRDEGEREIDAILKEEGVEVPFLALSFYYSDKERWLGGSGEPDLPLDADGAVAHAEFVIGEQDMARRKGPVARNVDYKKCRKHRVASGLKQADIAKLLDVTQVTICNFETGRNGVSMELLKQYAAAIGLSIDECFYAKEKIQLFPNGMDEPPDPKPRHKPSYVHVETRPRPSRQVMSEGHRVLKGLHDAMGKIVGETDKDAVLAIATQIVRIRDTLRKLEG